MMKSQFAVLGIFLIMSGMISPAQATPWKGREAVLDLIGRGTAAFDVGDIPGATGRWTEAIRLCKRASAPRLAAEALARRGEAYRVGGQFREAVDDLTNALTLARTAGDPTLIAATSGALGNLTFMSRRTATAEPLLLESHADARSLGDASVAGASANDLGNLYAATERPQQAALSYAEAIQQAQVTGDQTLAATAETNAARLALQRKNPGLAAVLLRSATDRLVRSKPSYQAALALVAVGKAALAGGQDLPPRLSAICQQAFEAAEEIARQLNQASLSALALGGLGNMRERLGQLEQASQFSERALFKAQQASAPDISFRLEWQKARIDRRLGHDDEALDDFRRSVSTLESVRQDIPVEYRNGRSSFEDSFGPLYLQFADLLLRRASHDPVNAPALLRETREMLEELKKAELQDYFRDTCIVSLNAKQRGVETIAPGTAVIYPVILPDRLVLLVSVGVNLRQIVVPISQAGLQAQVEQFRLLLERRSTNEFLIPAQRLYNLTIRPLDAMLARRKIETLVIVPGGILRTVPFAALHDGKHFLIERYAIATVPGLRLVDPRPLAPGPRRMLAMGISQSRAGFPALPDVLAEVEDIHHLEGGTILLNSAFLKSRFARDMRNIDYSIVHIASHGQFGSDPSQSFVLAYDGRLTLDNLENSIKLTRFREPGLELLVLSACQTAVGDDQAALGLAGLAVKAGARSAVATLWSVNDEASGPLMVDFYRQLQVGTMSKAHALQAAQLTLLADPLLSHPAYWAPFMLIGNWL